MNVGLSFVHLLSDLGDIRYKTSAHNAIDTSRVCENQHREHSAFLLVIN